MPVEIVCAQCGKTVLKSPSQTKYERCFCSRECYDAWRHQQSGVDAEAIVRLFREGTKPIGIAAELGVKHTTVLYWLRKRVPRDERRERQYESEPGAWVDILCALCGKGFRRRRYEVQRATARGRNLYCSMECFQAVNPRGEEHQWWQGGITSTEKRLRGGSENAAWRKAVFERDDYTCQVCGSKGGKLRAHHKIPVCKDDSLRFEVANGITLCVGCHKAAHKGRGGNREGMPIPVVQLRCVRALDAEFVEASRGLVEVAEQMWAARGQRDVLRLRLECLRERKRCIEAAIACSA